MILLTKAREFIPKRGYYFRSWMAVKYMTTMAFDLSLHEHRDQHREGGKCKLSKSDCMVRTRVWQCLFSLEIMVGAPQGRTDFAVEADTVDFSIPVASPEIDAFEYQTSRRFTYFSQNFRNVKQTNTLWQSMRRYKKGELLYHLPLRSSAETRETDDFPDWALDPSFVKHNEDLEVWLNSLPADLQIHYSEDGTPPWIGSDHLVAYIHVYHALVIVMHHRPQMQALLEKRDPAFNHHLDVCLRSAALMCRLQEALIRDFGLHGLQFMTRGINFTIYSVLTCTMLHLAAITSPDPSLNSQARQYFTRHMRVLEQCNVSASSEMQVQINALREAFSQDTSKPFELKSSLGLRSPALEHHPAPADPRQTIYTAPAPAAASWSHVTDANSSKTMTPDSEYGPPFEHLTASHSNPIQSSMPYQNSSYASAPSSSYGMHHLQQVTSVPQNAGGGASLDRVPSNEQQVTPVWDPSGIFNQWNSAFGPPQQQTSSPPNQVPNPGMPYSTPVPLPPQQPADPQAIYAAQQPTSMVPATALMAPPVPETVPAMPTVTPVMWQNAFTTAYVSGHGNKRYRQEDLDASSNYDLYPKRRG